MVRESEGVPPTVLTRVDSLIFKVKSRLEPGPYVELAGADTEEIVGPVRSIVMVVDEGVLTEGPTMFVEVPVTELASNCGVKVPSLQPLTVSVKVVPEAAEIANAHPVAVPAFEKSEFATPVKFSEAVMENVIEPVVFVGEV